jgi:hypothetical protein
MDMVEGIHERDVRDGEMIKDLGIDWIRIISISAMGRSTSMFISFAGVPTVFFSCIAALFVLWRAA